jgi:hypothetical protein
MTPANRALEAQDYQSRAARSAELQRQADHEITRSRLRVRRLKQVQQLYLDRERKPE